MTITSLYTDFRITLKLLTQITLLFTENIERDEVLALKKNMKTFEFVLILILECKLRRINLESKILQGKKIDIE